MSLNKHTKTSGNHSTIVLLLVMSIGNCVQHILDTLRDPNFVLVNTPEYALGPLVLHYYHGNLKINKDAF